MNGRSGLPMTDADWPVDEPAWHDGHAVWSIGLCLSAAGRAACLSLLDGRERDRADRFLRAQDRDRLIACHAALRLILAGLLDADARTLAFARSPSGKPELAGPEAERLRFNLSHSGEHALVAVSTTARIGVDVEVPRPMPDALRIARAHFHPREVAALAACGPAIEAGFYACWTGKEAFVKAVGAGLSMPLDGFAVAIPPAPPAILEIGGRNAPAAAWTLTALAPAPGVTGAVAIEAPRAACALRRLRPDWAERLPGP
ncbi:4'-phosphopantetheinyl transferase family protein [Methylobacterium sp. J-090]|uniref:4'-phosphopantetheinyl transferase family protein n=1 Tax=Methylobacterium sp. J-090 TaxID=2836666 RepID=UPI001FB88360|nr:4'-phosphopantetheinyl transferase superfamily protein [Methylobacterium sp. J-090]MCJ2081339.1 4'-phosphopantetheinyl transferase superfamily protein [Methylobacterium sp. J-090]